MYKWAKWYLYNNITNIIYTVSDAQDTWNEEKIITLCNNCYVRGNKFNIYAIFCKYINNTIEAKDRCVQTNVCLFKQRLPYHDLLGLYYESTEYLAKPHSSQKPTKHWNKGNYSIDIFLLG